MVLSRNWLTDFVNTTDIDIKEFCDRMTDTGSKVETYENTGDEIDNVRVGLIEKIEKHPDAEKLVVCQVNCGEKTLQIVTAAKNVFEGAIVPVCYCPQNEKRVTKLHGGTEIKTGKLRGVVSEGMFCSIEELGLTTHDMPDAATDGILILNGMDAKPGDDIKDVLMLNDDVIDYEITPNRPDCLSVIGLAREASATFGRKLTIPTPSVKESGDDINKYISVRIDDSEKCFRYTARVVKNVKIAPSPLWMRMRLRAAGVRPINNIVDITNYVMIEYGQPMHAFDYECIDGNQIIVRTAGDKEIFRTLDSQERELESDMLVIADGKKPVGIAGVMGGENSEITESTKTVVFESAMFLGSSVRITAKKLGMRTEASSRFEKGLDSENTLPALERACELINLLGAGDVVSGVIDVYPVKKPVATVEFEPDRINAFLGFNLSRDEMVAMLTSLEFRVDGDTIYVPSYRDDVRCMNDVAEEVVRMYGYNKVTSSSIVSAMTQGGLTPKQSFTDDVHSLLVGAGLDEIYTFSFMSARLYDKCGMAPDDERRQSVEIMNPFGDDTKTIRTTLIPTLLEVLQTNCSRSNPRVALYEIGKVFLPREGVVTNIHGLEGSLPDERRHISIGLYKAGDFYTLKGIIENIMAYAGIDASYVAVRNDPTYHPGRCAAVTVGDKCVGKFGQLHPTVAGNYAFDAEVYIAELDLEDIYDLSDMVKKYTPMPKFPATTRDFSFVCDETIEVGTIESAMRQSKAGKVIESITLFDIYRGAQLGEGKKSVSFSVSLRASDRTLTVEEADNFAEKILANVEAKLGITIRK